MANLTKRAHTQRTHLETAQAALSTLLADVDEVTLRNRQAMQRSPLVEPVLSPALDRLNGIRAGVAVALDELSSIWYAERADGWPFGSQADE